MIVVRMVFQAQFGKAHEVVDRMKQEQKRFREIVGDVAHVRILTDLSGPFDTVVQEIQVESLAEWERVRTKMFSDPRFQEMQASMPAVYVGGRAEFYTVEMEI